MEWNFRKGETWITLVIRITGYSSILFLALILIFLLREGIPVLGDTSLANLFGTTWYPIEEYFGILPLLTGSLLVTVGAILIAIPFGVGTAVYLSEVAPLWIKKSAQAHYRSAGRAPVGGFGLFGH